MMENQDIPKEDSNLPLASSSHGDDGDDDDDETFDLDVDVPLVITQIEQPKAQRPVEGLKWKDDAIQDCFQLALSTHDDEINNKERNYWSLPPFGNEDHEHLELWRPASLTLPFWAVDPYVLPTPSSPSLK